jgi:hypothetical protein
MQSTCIIWPDVACPGLQYFSTLIHNGAIFGKKENFVYKMRVLNFSTISFEESLILRRTEQAIIIKVHKF